MQKLITIEDREVRFSTSFAWMLKYKNQFCEDVSRIIIPATSASQKDKSGMGAIENIGFVGIARIAWSCAAICDKDILPFEEWVDSFDEFPIFQIATELLPDVFKSFSAKKK